MPQTMIDERVKSAILKVRSKLHLIIIDGKIVGITKKSPKERGSEKRIIQSYLRLKSNRINETENTLSKFTRISRIPKTGINTSFLDLSSSKMKKEEETIKSVLDFAVLESGYKSIISSFLSGSGKTKLAEYRTIFLSIEKEYQKAVASFRNAYSKAPGFQDFEKLDYLFNEESKIVISILDILMSKEEIPFDIYKNLNFIDKINSMRFLKKDWDSYGSYKIKPGIIQSAINFIEANNQYYKFLSFVAPLNYGGVHLAYKTNKTRVEINFLSTTKANIKIKNGDEVSSRIDNFTVSKKLLEQYL